jgi:predicted AlkP superfamily pyrophosphatase or phosphodiesterase
MRRPLYVLILIAGMLSISAVAQPRPIPPRPARYATSGWNAPAQRNKPYVILVSFDGFRSDYPDLFDPPNFKRVANKGCSRRRTAFGLSIKDFSQPSLDRHGLRAERHGIVSNSFYDADRGQKYSMSDKAAVTDSTWYLGEPVWVTAERQSMVTGTYFWPGSEAAN